MLSTLLGCLSGQPLQPPPPPPPEPWVYEDAAERLEDPHLARAGHGEQRSFFVDLAPLGRPDGVWLTYSYTEVTAPLAAAELAHASELSLAVRLLISEVGADRMLASSEALIESIGILYTVDNRLDPIVYNPENRESAPIFPGCGPEGSFYTCTNPQQYLGMATWRALDPASGYSPGMLEDAVDLAVLSWYLQERGLIADPTGEATNYVHRCGGAAYGAPTWRCDGHLGRPARDIPGGDPHTGPIAFKAPVRFLEHRGYYIVELSRFIDYTPQVIESPAPRQIQAAFGHCEAPSPTMDS